LIILTTVTLASSNSALPDDSDYTETCWSCFNVNFNTPFKAILLCISWWYNFDDIKMHDTTGKITEESVYYSVRTEALTLTLLTLGIRWAPNNASRWQMGINLEFKVLNIFSLIFFKKLNIRRIICCPLNNKCLIYKDSVPVLQWPHSVATPSKAWFCGRSLPGIVGVSSTVAWKSISSEGWVLAGRVFCEGPIPGREESYRVWVSRNVDRCNSKPLDLKLLGTKNQEVILTL